MSINPFVQLVTDPTQYADDLAKNREKKDLALRVGIWILAIFTIVALTVIIPLVTCWSIKLTHEAKKKAKAKAQAEAAAEAEAQAAAEAQAEAEARFKETTKTIIEQSEIEPIGDYAMIVKKADSKIQELFDFLIQDRNTMSQTVIVNIETGVVEKIKCVDPKSPSALNYRNIMNELAPTLLAYFNEVITKHPHHNKMAIDCDWILQETIYENKVFIFHQLEGDDNVYLDPCSFKKFINTRHTHNWAQWELGIGHKCDGLLLAYKKPKNSPILPAAITDYNNPIWCSPIKEGDILVLNNQTAYNALPRYDIVEVAYGKGFGNIFFDSNDHSKLNKETQGSLVLRIACSTFFKEEEDDSSS